MSSRRSAMTLFSAPHDPWSHRVRIVLAEKAIAADIISVEPGRLPEDLLDLNPYHSVPTLVDRDLVLYDARVVTEYLDERYPHPPLMPIDPIERAKLRLAMYRIERDWYQPACRLDRDAEGEDAPRLRRQLREAVIASTGLFRMKAYFLSAEFSLADACVAPVLWRLPHYGIDLPKEAQAIVRYAANMFPRPGFRASLSGAEQQMRVA